MSDWDAAEGLETMQKISLATANCAHCREIWVNLLGHIRRHEAAGRFVTVVDSS